MGTVVKFPKFERAEKRAAAVPAPAAPIPAQAPTTPPSKPRRNVLASIYNGLSRFVWVSVCLLWPIGKWVLSIEVFFQLVRCIYYWNTPGVHAGWTFLLHFAVLTALTYYVSIYKPKGL